MKIFCVGFFFCIMAYYVKFCRHAFYMCLVFKMRYKGGFLKSSTYKIILIVDRWTRLLNCFGRELYKCSQLQVSVFLACIGILALRTPTGAKSFRLLTRARRNAIDKRHRFTTREACVLRRVMIKSLKGTRLDNKWENIVAMCVDEID